MQLRGAQLIHVSLLLNHWLHSNMPFLDLVKISRVGAFFARVGSFFVTSLVLVIDVVLDAEVLDWEVVVDDEVVNDNDAPPTSERESVLLRNYWLRGLPLCL